MATMRSIFVFWTLFFVLDVWTIGGQARAVGQGSDDARIQSSSTTTSTTMKSTRSPKRASPTPAPSDAPPLIDPAVSRDIVKQLISSLTGGNSFGSSVLTSSGASVDPALKQLGPIAGLLPTLSKLSTPIAHLIVSKGNPSVQDLDQILQAVPDLAMSLGLTGAVLGNGLFGAKMAKNDQSTGGDSSNGTTNNIDDQSGDPTVNQSAIDPPQPPQIASDQTNGSASDFQPFTVEQIDDMANNRSAIPPMAALPIDYVRSIFGETLDGIPVDKIQVLKEIYLRQLFNGQLPAASTTQWPVNIIGGKSIKTTEGSITSSDFSAMPPAFPTPISLDPRFNTIDQSNSRPPFDQLPTADDSQSSSSDNWIPWVIVVVIMLALILGAILLVVFCLRRRRDRRRLQEQASPVNIDRTNEEARSIDGLSQMDGCKMSSCTDSTSIVDEEKQNRLNAQIEDRATWRMAGGW